MTIRVVVVDDQALVRGGFAMVLGQQDDIEVVARGRQRARGGRGRPHATAPTSSSWTSGCRSSTGSRRRAASSTEADRPVRVLILTTFDRTVRLPRRCVPGASGFILKDIPPEELPVAVRTVASGGSAARPVHHQAADRPVRPAARGRHSELVAAASCSPIGSARCCVAVAQGASNTEISAELFIGPATGSRTSPACSPSSDCATAPSWSCSPTRAGWSRPAAATRTDGRGGAAPPRSGGKAAGVCGQPHVGGAAALLASTT